MAGRNFHPSIQIEMKKREIEQRGGTNTDVVDMQAGREETLNHRLCVAVGREAAIPSHGDASPTFIGDDRPMNLTEEPGKVPIKVLLRQTANVILAKDRWVHCFPYLLFCRANLAAKRIASFMLEPSALSFPAMSYAVP